MNKGGGFRAQIINRVNATLGGPTKLHVRIGSTKTCLSYNKNAQQVATGIYKY